jgi:peptide/nickel transport system substrate-binding protein
MDKDLKPQPSLATKWSVDPQAGTYTFEIRRGVFWHDGQPFTPEDVKFAFEEILSKYDNFGATYFKDVTVTISGDTVVIKPANFLPGVQMALLSSPDAVIYPKHILQGQDFLKSPFRTTSPIGTGPFKMKTWVKGSHIELVRNENYWNQPMPHLDGIIIRFISDPAAIIAALQRGEIHYIFRGVPFEAYNTLRQTQSLQVVPYVRPPYASAMWMNTKAPYLSDVNVRRAIAYALNREDIATKATQGLSEPIQYMIDPTVVPPSPTLTIYNYDSARANRMLDEAGYNKGADGIRFTLELMTRTGEPDEQLWATLVRDHLAAVGIGLNIKTVDFATYLALQSKFEFQMATIKYWLNPIWTYQLFTTEWIGRGPFTNAFQYSDPETDDLMHAWLTESDPTKSVQILQKVEDRISQNLPEIILYEVRWLNVINADFQGADLPVGKWIFADSLENTYSASLQKTTVATTQTTETAPITAPGFPVETTTLVAAAAVILILIAAGFIWTRRKRPKT